ncbi:hypothetical protein KKH96_01955 [Patescibacteria group bacterium]|nr:hypothetical protein [Patescibacteria group bacterium]
MPTDKDTALRILLRKNKIRKEEWLKLIEARRLLIKQHLNSFTLTELGKTKCLKKNSDRYDYELCAELDFDDPKIISDDDRLSLDMQGIFYPQSWNKIKYDFPPSQGFPGGKIQIWGLSRFGQWIIAEVIFLGSAGYKHRKYETAETVKIEKTNLTIIIARTGEEPIKIWGKLGEAVKEWTERRKKLYNQALEINDIIKTENKILSLITFLSNI